MPEVHITEHLKRSSGLGSVQVRELLDSQRLGNHFPPVYSARFA